LARRSFGYNLLFHRYVSSAPTEVFDNKHEFTRQFTCLNCYIENGIYTSIIASIALLLFRIAVPKGQFLGRVTVHTGNEDKRSRDVYVPLSINGGVMNPHVKVEPPVNGVIIYRLEESITFPNSSSVNSALVDYAKEQTKRGKDMTNVPLSQRPWNDPG
jgi:sodium-independent sulfate anion transporter 11